VSGELELGEHVHEIEKRIKKIFKKRTQQQQQQQQQLKSLTPLLQLRHRYGLTYEQQHK